MNVTKCFFIIFLTTDIKITNLCLVTTRATATTSLFKLAAFAADIRLGAGVGHTRSTSKVLDRLTRVLRSTEEDSVGSSRLGQGKLIKSDDFTACFENAGAGSLGDTEGTDAHLRDLHETDIISDATDKDCGLSVFTLHEVNELGEGKRRTVCL